MVSVNGRSGAKCLKAPQFFKLCEWMKKQPQPIIMTRPALAAAAEADMGMPISPSTITSAIEATGVEVKTPGRGAPVPRAHDSRLRILASILIKVTDHMVMLAGPVITEEERGTLEHLAKAKGETEK